MKEIYCDESRQDLFFNKNSITDENRYIFIGGIMIDNENRDAIKQQINELKENSTGKKKKIYKNLLKFIDLVLAI